MGDIIFTREYQEIHNLYQYKIFVNNEEINTLANGARKVVRLKAGNYEVFVKVNGSKSPERQVKIKEKGTVRLSCGSSLSGLKFVFSWLFIFSKNNIYLNETI
jgi:hypothetical protein